MYEIEYYKRLEEKKEYFHCSKPIETEREFDEIWDILSSYKSGVGLIYRGTKKASYKLYSSVQREWNNLDLINWGIGFEEIILFATKIAKANPVIKKYFAENDILENNDLAYLSFLQHHYIPNKTYPTPLIDFTFNPFIALYFAFEGSKEKKNDYETENYCSIYSVNCHHHLLAGYQNLFYAFVNNEKESKLAYSNIKEVPFFHLYTENDCFKIINNQRIKNQEGTFFVNTCEKFPIEKRYKINIDFARSSNRVSPNATSQLFICYDFNISLRKYVLKRLGEEKGITENLIYPVNDGSYQENNLLNREII